MQRKTKVLHTRVEPKTYKAIIKLAEKYGVPVCQIVRWALAEYIERAEANDGE